jgi:hypothetical protein
MHKATFAKDRNNLILLFLLSIIFIYFSKSTKVLFYLTTLFLFVRSKKDYFWILYFFIIVQMPGGLFYPPFNTIINAQTNGISYTVIFILVVIIKFYIIKKKTHHNILFIQHIRVIGYYAIFLVIFSFILGVNFKGIYITFQNFLSIFLFCLIFDIFTDRENFIKFINLLFFSVIILFTWQIFDILSPVNFATLLGVENYSMSLDQNLEDYKLVRLFYSAYASFLALCFSLFYLLKKDFHYFSKKYLIIVAGVSLLGMLLTGTRGYAIQYIFILLCFVFLAGRRGIMVIPFTIIIIFILAIIFPKLNQQIEGAVQRYLTVQSLMSGDLTADNTLIRITERAPKVWSKYTESPIVGFGYSDIGRQYDDDHVGNYTLLLQGGIIGAAIYIYVIISIIFSLWINFYKKRQKETLMALSFIISLIIAHSTSSGVFSYYFEPHIMLTFAMLLLFYKFEFYQRNQIHY